MDKNIHLASYADCTDLMDHVAVGVLGVRVDLAVVDKCRVDIGNLGLVDGVVEAM